MIVLPVLSLMFLSFALGSVITYACMKHGSSIFGNGVRNSMIGQSLTPPLVTNDTVVSTSQDALSTNLENSVVEYRL